MIAKILISAAAFFLVLGWGEQVLGATLEKVIGG